MARLTTLICFFSFSWVTSFLRQFARKIWPMSSYVFTFMVGFFHNVVTQMVCLQLQKLFFYQFTVQQIPMLTPLAKISLTGSLLLSARKRLKSHNNENKMRTVQSYMFKNESTQDVQETKKCVLYFFFYQIILNIFSLFLLLVNLTSAL